MNFDKLVVGLVNSDVFDSYTLGNYGLILEHDVQNLNQRLFWDMDALLTN